MQRDDRALLDGRVHAACSLWQQRHLGTALIVVPFIAVLVALILPLSACASGFLVFATVLGWTGPGDLAGRYSVRRYAVDGLLVVFCYTIGLLMIPFAVLSFVYLPTAHLLFSILHAIGLVRLPEPANLTLTQGWDEGSTMCVPVGATPPPGALRPEAASERYVGRALVYEILKRCSSLKASDSHAAEEHQRDVRLLSLAWLLDQGRQGAVLPRRQELPPEAFLSAERLERIDRQATRKRRGLIHGFSHSMLERGAAGRFHRIIFEFWRSVLEHVSNPDGLLPIIAISYCWKEPHHPDADGRTLQLICAKLTQPGAFGGRGLLEACRAYGFSDMGVFLDWCSLYQKDPAMWSPQMSAAQMDRYESSRTVLPAHTLSEAQRVHGPFGSVAAAAAFKSALTGTMDLWYAHSRTTVILVTSLPETLPRGFNGRGYHERGWTTYERCSAELGKSETKHAQWNLVIDLSASDYLAERRLPTPPHAMRDVMSSKTFTNSADHEAVITLYERTAADVLLGLRFWSFAGLPLHDEARVTLLAQTLNYCDSLERLALQGCRLNDASVTVLSQSLRKDALPELKVLALANNRFGPVGMRALVGALVMRCIAPQLRSLQIGGTPLGDEGVAALAAVLREGKLYELRELAMPGVGMGAAGAASLAAALNSGEAAARARGSAAERRAASAAPSLARFSWILNRAGAGGRAALVGALDARGIAATWFLTAHTFAFPRAALPFLTAGMTTMSEDCHGPVISAILPARLFHVPKRVPPSRGASTPRANTLHTLAVQVAASDRA